MTSAPTTAAQLIRWPAQADRRRALGEMGVPCLLVVADGASPPIVDEGEDWIARSADERDVAARLSSLARRGRVPTTRPTPVIGEDLVRSERQLLAHLLRHPGRYVRRSDISGDELDASIASLRRREGDSGWRIHVVGDHGLLLELEAVDP